MNLKCKTHNGEIIDRICASTRWKADPALCWQCMVDQAPNVKEQKEHIVKVDLFVDRIAKEFDKLVELRRQDQPKAKGEHMQLYDEGQLYVEAFRSTINKRKDWLYTIIQGIIENVTEECRKLQSSITDQYDQKLKHFEELYGSLRSTVELRYGLAALPSAQEMNNHLQELSEQEGDCNPYIRDLKDKLLPPMELDRNLQFQETLAEFYQLYEISEEVRKEGEKENEEKVEGEEADDAEDDNGDKVALDALGLDILRQCQDQCQVLFEEFTVGIQYRDPMLGRNPQQQSRYKDLNESLNTIFSPEKMSISRQRQTVAQKLYDMSPFKDAKENQLITSNGKRGLESQVSRKQFRIVSHDQTIRTDQSRGITAIVLLQPNCIATASRDKTIQVTNIDNLNDYFTLTGHTDQVTALCPFQSKILVSGGGNLDSTLIVWSLSQRKALHVMKGHQSGITSIIDLLDGHAVASGSYDNHAIIWDVHEGQAVCALRKHTAMISSLQLTQRRDHMLTGSWDRTIGVWEFSFETGARNIKGAKYIREIKCDSAVLCMHSIGERQVAYGGTGNRVVVLDWVSSEIKRKLSTSQFGIQELRLSGHILVGLGATDGTLRVWDLQSRENTEKEVLRDQEHIFINNFNTSPKMSDLGDGRVGIVNSSDSPAVFNVFNISTD